MDASVAARCGRPPPSRDEDELGWIEDGKVEYPDGVLVVGAPCRPCPGTGGRVDRDVAPSVVSESSELRKELTVELTVTISVTSLRREVDGVSSPRRAFFPDRRFPTVSPASVARSVDCSPFARRSSS
jgi:hypothetical protein